MTTTEGETMKVAAMFVGKPRSVTVADGTLLTGGSKSPVEAAFLRFDNFEGDGQGNLQFHGGRDRSVCVYIAEHYAWWKSEHGYEIRYGSFCENLTVEGVAEDQVCIGDVFRAGDALVQVSLPRDPCRTIDRLTGIPDLWKQARDSGRLGFHMRTLEEGLVRTGDAFDLVRAHPEHVTVAEVLALYHGRSRDVELAERLSRMPEFAWQGKNDIARRMAGK
ncbi:MAG: MOSC domain-containing protein [Spirochaetia bacterium]|jgi:MOSC domain-containing protein YiiM